MLLARGVDDVVLILGHARLDCHTFESSLRFLSEHGVLQAIVLGHRLGFMESGLHGQHVCAELFRRGSRNLIGGHAASGGGPLSLRLGLSINGGWWGRHV